jgi:hypothetical protein
VRHGSLIILSIIASLFPRLFNTGAVHRLNKLPDQDFTMCRGCSLLLKQRMDDKAAFPRLRLGRVKSFTSCDKNSKSDQAN